LDNQTRTDSLRFGSLANLIINPNDSNALQHNIKYSMYRLGTSLVVEDQHLKHYLQNIEPP